MFLLVSLRSLSFLPGGIYSKKNGIMKYSFRKKINYKTVIINCEVYNGKLFIVCNDYSC